MANVQSVTTIFTGTYALVTAITDELAGSELIFDEDININRTGTLSTVHNYLVSGLSKTTTYNYILRFQFSSIALESTGSLTTTESDDILNEDGTTTTPGGEEGSEPGSGDGDTGGSDGILGQPSFLSVEVFSDLPAAALNSGSLFLVLGDEGSGVDTKYGGYYRSSGSAWEYLGPNTANILSLTQLQLTEAKNFDSAVTANEVGKGGYFEGYFYFAHTIGPAASGQPQWSRTAVANKGF